MSSPSWGYAPIGVFILLLVVILAWVLVGERPFFRSTEGNIKENVQDIGENIKSTGRDVADSIRRTVQ